MKIVKSCNQWMHAVCIAMLFSAGVSATELVYAPVNPTFGGNPNNAPGLLANAQAQNHFKAPVNSALQNFNNNLQNAILSRLSSQALLLMFGKNSALVPGDYDTANYAIKVTDAGAGGLTIETTDKSSGAIATFNVSASTLGQ